MNSIPFAAKVISGEEEEAVIADIRSRLKTLPKVGDIERWERGWTENLEAYNRSGLHSDLRPKYIRPGLPMRLYGRFVKPLNHDAEWIWYETFRDELVRRYLSKMLTVYEFGSGSGHNLARMKAMDLKQSIIGCDWSWAAVKIADAIDTGTRFDFRNPVLPNFGPHTGVLTIGALEQTGHRAWTPFAEELILARPSVCVHLEPIVEWYDQGNPVDRTAIEVHEAKGFWVGFWDWCRAKRREGKIEIMAARRTGVGSLMVEGYSLIVWRPL